MMRRSGNKDDTRFGISAPHHGSKSRLRQLKILGKGESIDGSNLGAVNAASATRHTRNGSIRSSPNFDALRQYFSRQRAGSRLSSRTDSVTSVDSSQVPDGDEKKPRKAGGRRIAKKPRAVRRPPQLPESPEAFVRRQRLEAEEEHLKKQEAMKEVREHRLPLTSLNITLPKKLKDLASRDREAMHQAKVAASLYRAQSLIAPSKPEKVKRRSSGNPMYMTCDAVDGLSESVNSEPKSLSVGSSAESVAATTSVDHEIALEEKDEHVATGVVSQVWNSVASTGVVAAVSNIWNRVRPYPADDTVIANESDGEPDPPATNADTKEASVSEDLGVVMDKDVVAIAGDVTELQVIQPVDSEELIVQGDTSETHLNQRDGSSQVQGEPSENPEESVLPETLGEPLRRRESVKDMIEMFNRRDSGVSPLEWLKRPIGTSKPASERVATFEAAYGSSNLDDESLDSDSESSDSDGESSDSESESSDSESESSDSESEASDSDHVDEYVETSEHVDEDAETSVYKITKLTSQETEQRAFTESFHLEIDEEASSGSDGDESDDDSESDEDEVSSKGSGMVRWRESMMQSEEFNDLFDDVDQRVVHGKNLIVTGFEMANLASVDDDEDSESSFGEFVDQQVADDLGDIENDSQDSASSKDTSDSSSISDDGVPGAHEVTEGDLNVDPEVIDTLARNSGRPSGVEAFVASLSRQGSTGSSTGSLGSLDSELDGQVVNNKEEISLVFKVLSHSGGSLRELTNEG